MILLNSKKNGRKIMLGKNKSKDELKLLFEWSCLCVRGRMNYV
jgi:hypothetical protein